MGKELDLDDVAATSPLAARELAELRADRDRYSDLLDVSQGVVRNLRARVAELEAQIAAPAQDAVREGFTLVENKALYTARMALAHATTTHGELYRDAYESLLAVGKGGKP